MDQPASPIILESNNPQKGFSSKLGSMLPKIIFAIFGIVIIVELYIGYQALTKPSVVPAKIQPLSGGKVMLISPKKAFKKGENIDLDIRISTGGHVTSGVDAVLRFDPQLIAINPGAISLGTIFPDYPIKSIDAKKGLIQISAISAVNNSGFNGVGILARVKLQAKSSGSGSVIVDFKPGITQDSNVLDARSGQDILDKVYNFNYQIN